MSAATRSIDTSIEIHAPASAVWEAISTAQGLMNWFPLEAKVTPGVGGKIWSSWDADFQGECRIDVWEPNRRLRVVYPQLSPSAEATANEPTEAGAPTKWEQQKEEGKGAAPPPELAATDYILESHGGSTTLRLVHSGFSKDAVWDELFDATKRGWSFELRGLRHYVEKHNGVKRRVIKSKLVFDFPVEEGWRRIMSAEGLLKQGRFERTEEGAPFSVTAATGDELQGRVQVLTAPKQVALVVENWNNGLLRLHIDEWSFPKPRKDAYLWISLFGMAESERRGIEERWTELFARLFGAG